MRFLIYILLFPLYLLAQNNVKINSSVTVKTNGDIETTGTFSVDSLTSTSGISAPIITAGTSPNTVQLDPVKGVVLSGYSTVWEDSQVPALSISTGATAPSLTTGFAGNADFRLYYFQGGTSTNDQCWLSVQFSHAILSGDTLYAHIHWSPTTNVAAGSDTVVWELTYTYQDLMAQFNSGDTLTVKCAPGANKQWYHQINNFPVITSKGISSIMICRLRRLDSDASDTYAANAAFLGFDVHYKRNTEGSQLPTIK